MAAPLNRKKSVMAATNAAVQRRELSNRGKLIRQTTPFGLEEIQAIRIRLKIGNRLALFDSAIDRAKL